MDLDMMLADEEHAIQIRDIKKTIDLLKEVGVTDHDRILQLLSQKYGKTFDKEDLEEVMKEAK